MWHVTAAGRQAKRRRRVRRRPGKPDGEQARWCDDVPTTRRRARPSVIARGEVSVKNSRVAAPKTCAPQAKPIGREIPQIAWHPSEITSAENAQVQSRDLTRSINKKFTQMPKPIKFKQF